MPEVCISSRCSSSGYPSSQCLSPDTSQGAARLSPAALPAAALGGAAQAKGRNCHAHLPPAGRDFSPSFPGRFPSLVGQSQSQEASGEFLSGAYAHRAAKCLSAAPHTIRMSAHSSSPCRGKWSSKTGTCDGCWAFQRDSHVTSERDMSPCYTSGAPELQPAVSAVTPCLTSVSRPGARSQLALQAFVRLHGRTTAQRAEKTWQELYTEARTLGE